MKSKTLTCITAMTLFAALAHLCLNAQEPGGAAAVAANPVPLINQPLAPDAIKPGGTGFTLTVNGTGFVPASVVKWNGSARATKFANRSKLTASILSTDVAKASTASVTVVNSTPGGGTSNIAF